MGHFTVFMQRPRCGPVLTATLDEEDRDAFGARDGVVVSSSGRAMVGTMTVWCAP